MLLRPATPLTILFFAAFVLLLLSTISTPIVKSIPLASFDGVDLGVFGYCTSTGCSKEQIGYNSDNLWGSGNNGDFTLPSNTRHSLSSILIVHPIAALMTGICTLLAFASHFQGPAHSPRFLLALLILSFPTLLITLLAFLVDILLFIPHLAWGGWIVLAATIIITACSLLTCAMRRLLVSRKARKKRIAENAEMNGQAYYETRAEQQFARAESPPPLNVKPVNGGKAQFATFEVSRKQVQEDRVPLTAPQQPSPPSTTGRGNPATQNSYRGTDSSVPMVPMVTGNPPGREARRNERRTPPESPIDGQRRPSSPSNMFNRDFPDARLAGPVGSNGRSMGPRQGGPPGMAGARGRGFPPRGGMPPRGGFPLRGSYGRGSPQGMRGPPPPGWNGNRGGLPMGPGRGGPMMRGRGGLPPVYPNRPYNGPPNAPGTRPNGSQPLSRPYGVTNPYMRRPSGGSTGPQQNNDGYLTDITQSPNDENPNGIVPAVEAPADEYAPGRVFSMYSQPGGATDNVNNVNGVESARETSGVNPNGQPHDPLTYIFGNPHEIANHENVQVPRLNTTALPGTAVEMDAAGGSPLRKHTSNHTPASPVEMGMPASPRHRQRSPYDTSLTHSHNASPIELPTTTSQPTSPTSPTDPAHVHPALRTTHSRTASETYYEDVDPRFASEDPVSTIGPLAPADPSTSAPRHPSEPRIPSYIARQRHLLNPGTASTTSSFYADPNAPMDPSDLENGDDENAALRARSPAVSETSNFTSVSQRGINPNWRPVGAPLPGSAYNNSSQFTSRGGGPGGAGGRWKGEASSSLSILEANPDFMLPGVGGRGRGAGGRSAMSGGSMMGASGMGSPGRNGVGGARQSGVVPGMLGVGRYPTDV